MCVLDQEGDEVLWRRVEATEQGIDEAFDAFGGERWSGSTWYDVPSAGCSALLLARQLRHYLATVSLTGPLGELA
jgi:hypothetical protein